MSRKRSADFMDFPEWPYPYKTRRNGYCLDAGHRVPSLVGKGGRGKRYFFKTRTAALKKARELNTELNQGGQHNFTDATTRLDALNARALLDARKVQDSLTEAVRYYLDRKYPSGGDIRVSTLVRDFRKHKMDNRKLSDVYKVSLHRFLEFGRAFDRRYCSTLTVQDVLDYIYRHNWKPETQRQHYRYLRMMFNWAVEQSHMAVNPLDREHEPLGHEDEPGILTLDQARDLVNAAWAHPDKRLFPYLILGMFAGIRPHEIARLRWDAIRGNYSVVRITRKISKTNDYRNVPLPHCAKAMLVSYTIKHAVNQTDMLVPGTWNWFKRLFKEMAHSVGIKPWPHDGMRHTFASYFHDAKQDIDALQLRMGHSTPRTSLDHYVNQIDPVHKYWTSFFTLYCDDFSKREMQTILDSCTIPPAQRGGKPSLDEDKLRTYI